jgi:hypothetical protein
MFFFNRFWFNPASGSKSRFWFKVLVIQLLLQVGYCTYLYQGTIVPRLQLDYLGYFFHGCASCWTTGFFFPNWILKRMNPTKEVIRARRTRVSESRPTAHVDNIASRFDHKRIQLIDSTGPHCLTPFFDQTNERAI